MNKTKMWHMMAAFAIMAFFITATMPDSSVMGAPVNGGTQYGCACSCGTTNGKPLNFNEVAKNVQDFTADLQELEKQIKEKKRLLLELYKKTKEGILWKEIEDLEIEINELEGLYTQKRDAHFEMEALQKYTELQKDGTLKIKVETLPQIEDLDLEVSKAANYKEFTAREIMEKRSKIRELMFGKNYWEKKNWNTMTKEFVKIPELDTNELEKVYKEMEDLDSQYWKYRENYLELSLIQKMKGELARGNDILLNLSLQLQCPPKQPPLLEDYWYYFSNFQKTRVWVGIYDTEVPYEPNMKAEFCTTTYSTSMTYYWNEAKKRYSGLRSIQIKWFYNAVYASYTRSVIWEGNKSASYGEWYTYGRYTTTNPRNGSYQVTVNPEWMECCQPPYQSYKWCNRHCGLCFGCDASAKQNFSRTTTIP